MKAHEIMQVQDKISVLINVSDMLRFEGHFGDAADLDQAADTMTELLERLRASAANDG